MMPYTCTSNESMISDYYIKSISATILAVIKAIEGIVAGYALFILMTLLGTSRRHNQTAESAITSVVDTFLKPVINVFPALKNIPNSVKNFIGTSQTVTTIIVYIVEVCLLLVTVEAIAFLFLRFAKKGSSVISGIHLLHCFVAVVGIIGTIMVYFNAFQTTWSVKRSAIPLLSTVSGLAVGNPFITFVIPCLLQLLPLYIIFCYHKNIVDAMKKARYEIATNTPERTFRKATLDVFCTILGIIGLFYTIILYFNCGILTYIPAIGTSVKYLLFAAFLFTAKQFAISKCYGNLIH